MGFVHGPAGVGKTTLVDVVVADARACGVAVVRLDCRTVEPTERGVLEAVSGAVGGVGEGEMVEARLSGLGGRVLLVLDTYESLRSVDDWVRLSFVPALSANVRVLLAGRDAPVSGWAAMFGSLFLALPLSNLSPDAAGELLRREGVAPAEGRRLNRVARGHPLALRLSAAALAARPELDLEAVATRTVIEELTRLFLDGLDPVTRRALDAASVVRRPTRSLLGAMLVDMAATEEAFARLRRLPFVGVDRDGLVLHDTVREAVAAALRADDPVAYRAYRVAAWRQLRGELGQAAPRELWRYTADTLYLLENPLLREGYFPTTDHLYAMEPAKPEDDAAVQEIVARHEPAATVALFERWWGQVPESFRVARGRGGGVAGVLCVCEFDAVPYGLVDADPVASAWREHLRRDPVPRGQRVLVTRFRLALEGGEAVSPAQAALWLDITRLALTLRPELRRRYTVFRDFVAFGPILAPLGFRELPDSPVAIDGVAYHVPVLDFGPASVDGWLSAMVAAELHVDDDDGVLDAHRRQLVADGARVDLTRLEFELLQYLEQREGQAVERRAILRDVWGYEFGPSNVIETVVSSLRRKLGERAWMVETVRGVGYRYRTHKA